MSANRHQPRTAGARAPSRVRAATEQGAPGLYPARLLTREEARAYLGGVTPEKAGVPGIKLGKFVRFDRDVIDSKLDAISGLTADREHPSQPDGDQAADAALEEWEAGLEAAGRS